MAIPASFDSATGALTGDNLDHAIATGRDAARLTPSLRGDPDAGGQIQSAVHRPTPSLRGDPDAGGQIQSAVHRPTPSLRGDPDAGGQIQSAMHRPTPSLRDDPDAGGQIQSAVHRPTPSLRDDPDAGGQIQGQLVMLGSTSRLVQAMASFSAAGAADTSNMLPLGAETSQPPFLTTPQHP
jgi:hypothetical protein